MQNSPIIITIFGVTGDLSQKKLLPAIYDFVTTTHFSRPYAIIGYGRRPWQRTDFLAFVQTALEQHHSSTNDFRDFLDHVFYQEGQFNSVDGFLALAQTISHQETTFDSPALRLFYLATAPEFFAPLTQYLKEAGLHTAPYSEPPRFIIEKPFGTNLITAQQLNKTLHTAFREEQTYRIDHYLGKPIVRLLPHFHAALHLNSIDHVLITLAESVGIGSRGAYYDATGATRDMIQNHGLAILAQLLVAPNAEPLSEARAQIIEKLHLEDFTLGQYKGYTLESHVTPDSHTDTFAAIKLLFDHTLPVYIRAGKRLKTKLSEVVIHFKEPIPTLGHKITIMIDPTQSVEPTLLDIAVPEQSNPYTNLLQDAINNQHDYFVSDLEVEASWRTLALLIDQLGKIKPHEYEPGTWGPAESDSLIQKDNRNWNV